MQTANLSGYYNALRKGTTVSDIDTVGDHYDQFINELLAGQGIVDTDYAEGGSVSVSKPTISGYTTPNYAPRELGQFQGNLSAHTSSSLGEIKEFQSRLEPLMAEEMARLQFINKLDYEDAIEQAYLQNPEIQALYNQYDVDPFRASADGSVYLYDPFTFGEIRTLEVKDNDLKNVMKTLHSLVISAATSGFGAKLPLELGTLGTAVADAGMSAFKTAAMGGDSDDALMAGLQAGGSSFLQGVLNKAPEIKQTAASDTVSDTAVDVSADPTSIYGKTGDLTKDPERYLSNQQFQTQVAGFDPTLPDLNDYSQYNLTAPQVNLGGVNLSPDNSLANFGLSSPEHLDLYLQNNLQHMA